MSAWALSVVDTLIIGFVLQVWEQQVRKLLEELMDAIKPLMHEIDPRAIQKTLKELRELGVDGCGIAECERRLKLAEKVRQQLNEIRELGVSDLQAKYH